MLKALCSANAACLSDFSYSLIPGARRLTNQENFNEANYFTKDKEEKT